MEITATPDARTATVDLYIENVSGVTGILRSDANGTRPVRLRAEDLTGTGMRTVVDYEPALAGRILYRVRAGAGEVGQAWTQLDGAELPRFIVPSVPQFAVIADAVHSYRATRKTRAKFHEVINRPGPLVSAGKLAPRTGSMTLTFPTYSALADLQNVLERGQTVMFRQFEHPGMDMYFHAETVAVDARPEEEEWSLDIGFVEVDFPAGPVLSERGWTFDVLANRYGSFDEVAQVFDTFHDLTVGGIA